MKTSLVPRSLLLVLIGLLSPGTGNASTVVVPSDEEMIIGARAIVRGVVLSSVSGFDEQHQAIFTYTTLQVHQVLKGSITTREIVIKEPGGVAGGRGSILYGIPYFSAQEEVLLYLDTWPDGSLRVYHWFVGKFRITRDAATGQASLEREPAHDRVTVLGQSQRGLVTDRSDLASYLERIAVQVTELTVPSLQHEAQFFGATPLLALPTEIASVDHLRLSPQYTLLNPIQPLRWFEPDEGRPIDFRINPIGIPNPRIVEDILASMAIWSTVPGAAIRLLLGGFTSTCGLTTIDGENTVSFNNCDRYSAFSPPTGGGCAGVLAAAGITHFDTSQRREVNGIVFSRALEGNVSFNPHASCFFADPCNVREIATHELGHALGFGHSKDPRASLYAFAHFDGRCGSLRSDDEAGARFLYPQTGVAAPPVIITSTLPGGQAGVYYDHLLTASGGTPPYRWQISSGGAPGGMTLTNEGSLRGQPLEAGRYEFDVAVTDAAGLRVTKELQLSITPRPVGPTPTPVVGNNGLQFYPLSSPVRWLDTRFRDGSCNSPRSAIGSGQSLRISGVGPCFNARIPDTAQVLVGHATVINPGRGSGEYQILPAGMAPRETGRIGFQPYQVKTTSFMVSLNVEGAIEIHTTSQLHVVLEVVGYFAPPGPGGLYFHPLPNPIRFLDTQASGPSCLSHSFPLGTGGTHVERVALKCFGTTIPASARGFVGNLTVTNLSTTLGTITLYPALVSRPQTVNLQLTGGETVSNQVVVGLSPGGLFSTYTSTRMHVALDLSGYFSPEAVDSNGVGTLFYPFSQGIRLFQTQAAGQGPASSQGDSCQQQTEPLSAHQEVTIQARGVCGGGSIPGDAVAVSGMVGTPPFSSAGQGVVTFFPADRNRPRSINLLLTPTPSSTNGFVVRLSRNGEFRAATDRSLDLWIDVGGYFAP